MLDWIKSSICLYCRSVACFVIEVYCFMLPCYQERMYKDYCVFWAIVAKFRDCPCWHIQNESLLYYSKCFAPFPSIFADLHFLCGQLLLVICSFSFDSFFVIILCVHLLFLYLIWGSWQFSSIIILQPLFHELLVKAVHFLHQALMFLFINSQLRWSEHSILSSMQLDSR